MTEIICCIDCRYFHEDVWEIVQGIPLIIAHEICEKWGGGSKTSPDGYCFMGERRIEPDGPE